MSLFSPPPPPEKKEGKGLNLFFLFFVFRLETAEQEAFTARTDLRLAVKRIEDLQSAISGEIGSDSERSERYNNNNNDNNST